MQPSAPAVQARLMVNNLPAKLAVSGLGSIRGATSVVAELFACNGRRYDSTGGLQKH